MIFPSTSKRPVLLVGNGARAAGASEAVYEFSDRTRIPVLTSMIAVDMTQGADDFGFIGTYGTRVANTIIAECDLVVAVGIRLGLRQIGRRPALFAPKAKLIRADIDQYELGRTVKPDEEKKLVDAKEFMERLNGEEVPRYDGWRSTCERLRGALDGVDDVTGNLAIKAISELLPENPLVAVDVGQNQCWAAQSLKLKGRKGRILIGGGYGSMGCGLPFAIGASIANGKGRVYCITGDGGLQMNIQELEVLVREGLPVKVLVLNNRALGKISEIQEKSYDRRFAQTTAGSGYTVPNFEEVARAYGLRSVSLGSYERLKEYSGWLTDDEPCLIDIALPDNTLLIPKLDFASMEVKPTLDACKAREVEAILHG